MMVDDLLKFLGLPVTIATTVALTFEKVTGLDLVLRLIFTLILAGVMQEIIARTMALKPKKNPAGFRLHDELTVKSRNRRPITAIMALAMVAAVATGLAWLQTEYFVVSAVRGEHDGSRSLTLRASVIEAEYVFLPLPPLPVECNVTDVDGATFTEFDWEQPDRLLRIDGFVAPQSAFIICDTDTPLGQRRFRVEGPADGPYFSDQLFKLRFLIFIFGGLLWLYGLVRLRKYS